MKSFTTSSIEDYLKAIFELGENDVKTKDIANYFDFSPASVTGMLRKLSKLNLVSYKKYYGVSLTTQGRLMALETIRHHRLIETYLIQALGYEWHEVHDEADRLEHVISEDFEERIANLLGHPSYDPHGDPIPHKNGTIPRLLGKPLTSFKVGANIVLTRITKQDSDILQYLAEQKLMPGNAFIIEARAPFDGPLTLNQGAKPIAIAHSLAKSIYAEAVTN